MAAEVDHDRVRLRSYQAEMLEKSLKQNVIVAMDTGSGKTHVAIARIQAELERSESDKLIWFMTPSRPLSKQQFEVLQEHLPAYHIRSLTGADGVDKWTDQRLWDAFLAGVDVVVGTPAVLADALTHAFVRMSGLSLLVFDEAHRTTKDHPMNKIMRDFYYPAKHQGAETPHILGLSASPVMKSDASESGLEAIESNLDATTITPKRFRDELESHVHQPTLTKVFHGSGVPDDNSPAFDTLVAEFKAYDFAQDPYIESLREQNDDRAIRQLKGAWIKRKTYCTEQLHVLLNRASHVKEQLGNNMAEWYIFTCARRFLDGKDYSLLIVDDLETREKQHLAGIMTRIISHIQGDKKLVSTNAATSDVQRVSEKARALQDILFGSAASNLRSIIFVEQRAMVASLAHLLRSATQISESYNIGTFMGSSSFANRKTDLGDLVDHKAQDQDLQDFRNGSKNLMISTTVLEEGIDIPACNSVICFDLPTSLISFVQRRGRARKADSQYMLFVTEAGMKADPIRFQRLENMMKEAYMREHREQSSVAGSEVDDTSNVRYLVESTGALLMIDNAKSHLHHFCAVSTRHVSRYIDPRPEFETNEVCTGSTGKHWTASATLPSFVHKSVRVAYSSLSWRSEATAIKEAAFNAYVALHGAGLINDNLLPVVKDYVRDPGQVHINQPSLVQVSERQSAWDVCMTDGSDIAWHTSKITLFLEEHEILTQTLFLPFRSRDAQDVLLYWNHEATYRARITPSEDANLPSDHELLAASGWTSTILRSVFASRMSDHQNDLAFLLVPPSDFVHNGQLSAHTGSEPAYRRLDAISDRAQCGLVHVDGQQCRVYMLQDVCESAQSGTGTEPTAFHPEKQVVLTPFPKRRDFLHIPPTDGSSVNAAYTSRQSFPMSQCEIERLPASYSLLAVFLPSILHQLEVTFMADKLNSSTPHLSNPSLVVQALCPPAANEQIGDYNRLEYLGDSILKFCTELQIVAQHSTWPEAYLSAEKDRIVRNDNLAKASLDAGLDRFILTKPFTGSKWQSPCLDRPPGMANERKREMSSKVLADVVEALIGAAFVDGGLSKAYDCIKILLARETWWPRHEHFDRILEETDGIASPANLHILESLVGHEFSRPALLLEAITHASYPHNNQTSYERLEFLGDAVLDLIVTPKLFAHPRKLRHWDLHRVHEALVNGHFLGFCCMTVSVAGDAKYEIVNIGSTKTPQQTEAKQYYLHDFIRASAQLITAKRVSINRFETLRESIATALQTSDTYPWPDLAALHPEKFLSDIVEAILGAIYLDTRGDLAACEAFLEKLGVLPLLRGILDREVETAFPKERVGILADRSQVMYATEQPAENASGWSCAVLVGEREITSVHGCASREEAEVRAADMAARVMMVELGADDTGKRNRKRKLHVRGEEQMENVDMLDDGTG
ncbi:hypothetical protein Q7P37_003834 [Cladosporium fusiforme]